MAFNGLNEFIRILDLNGQLLRISKLVDPTYEIAEITDRICKQEGGGKAILFENTGSSFPVLTNTLGSHQRVDMALGNHKLEILSDKIQSFFEIKQSSSHPFLDVFFNSATQSKSYNYKPISISGKGDSQRIVDLEPDLRKIPISKSWPYDGGPFLPLTLVNSKDPFTGGRMFGANSVQVLSSTLMSLIWPKYDGFFTMFSQYKRLEQQMPIAIVLGGDPIYTLIAKANLPSIIDPYALVGYLRERKVKLVKGITVDVEVPSDADIVIEGYVDPNEELIWEGSYGSRTGFYSLGDWHPKFYVTCITHRNDAVLPVAVTGTPPNEEDFIGKAIERISLGMIQTQIPSEIVDINIPYQIGLQNVAIVKINKTYPGQTSKVANALWGSPQLALNKILVIVSSNINIHKTNEVFSTISKFYNPATDTGFGKGPADILDHSNVRSGFGGKLLIDATEKFPEEQTVSTYHEIPDPEVVSEILGDKEVSIAGFRTHLLSLGYSILLVSIDKSNGVNARTVATPIVRKLELSLPKIIIVVDKELNLEDIPLVCWYAISNADPARDCFYIDSGGKHMPCLVVDGTRKAFSIDNNNRDWPNVVVSSRDTINDIDSKWSSLGIGAVIPSPSKRFYNLIHSESAICK